ncbi:MAG: peptide chain release factor 1 [Planctomycetes bacterium]|nr:peptide chain release factor 1 [Planctomycetota bacterium]
MNIREELDKKLDRYEEIDRLLIDPAVLSDSNKLAALSRERGSLNKVASKYKRFKDLVQQIAEANEMVAGGDKDLRELAEAELPGLRDEREALWNELLEMTAGGDDANRTRCVFEIRAGTGGEEAGLWARDLYDMYKKYIEANGWKVEILDMNATELGGFKQLVLGISGEGSYRVLQYESGGHRVQRVPETEAKGRLQTSMATVAVMPEPEDVEIDLKPDDYRKDLFCASGPGGQHVNKTESAVRLTHLATGIVVQCQDEKSQHKNLAKALRVLKTRLYEHFRQQEESKRSEARKTLVGSGDRSERIRTYNYPENRITDHRINLSLYKLDQVLGGNLTPVTQALIDYDRDQLRSQFGAVE